MTNDKCQMSNVKCQMSLEIVPIRRWRLPGVLGALVVGPRCRSVRFAEAGGWRGWW